MLRLAGGWLLLAVWLAAPAGAQAACVVQPRTAVALQAMAGHLVVPVMVNGIVAQLVLDTGAERSLVTPAAVQRLGLTLDEWVGSRMRGVGGIVEHRNASPRSLSLGGIALQRRTLTRDTSLTVGPIPLAERSGQAIDGLLGRDFLSRFDLALDLRAGSAVPSVTLYDVHDCGGRFLPWTQPYTAIQARQPTDTALVLAVTLDGVALRALLDTGANATLLTAPGTIRSGLTPARLAQDAAAQGGGVGVHPVSMWQHHFGTLQVGEDSWSQPRLWVAPAVRVVPIVDMLLGADWLAGRLVWISFATSQVFVTAR